MSDHKGASLLEVVIVGGLVASLLGITWLAEPLLSRVALRSAAATLVADLRLAQARAIAEREPDRRHGIEFRPGDARYVIFARTGTVTIAVLERRLPARVRLTFVRFGGTTPSSVFFTGVSLLGAPSGGGTVTLAAGNARLCVRVMPATGRVRVSNVGCP